uniref:Uncharacterized protein n=1 Tax=Arundo donax TaxID=35708 RepID=A0A0A9E4V6_ARUDO
MYTVLYTVKPWLHGSSKDCLCLSKQSLSFFLPNPHPSTTKKMNAD